MKCPGCGDELGTIPVCSKCGFNHAGNKDEIDVEYKDFKTSELLEIRRKRQAAPPGKEPITEGKLKTQISAESSSGNRKNSVPVSALIALVLILISFLFVFFRYLVQR